jgi:hypothetical protein
VGVDDDLLELELVVAADPESGPGEAEQLTGWLRRELLDLDVESIEYPRTGVVPAGSKGDPVSLGALIIALSASGGVFPTLIATIRGWLGRQTSGPKVTLTIDGDTIELERTTAAQQQELVEAFVRRHSPK